MTMRRVRNEDRTMKRERFEVLAPAGSMEILKAVLEAGADAVYVGGQRFGARAYANNFSDEELLAAIDYVHLHEKKLYLTVNTLMKNRELPELIEYLKVKLHEREFHTDCIFKAYAIIQKTDMAKRRWDIWKILTPES